jgi:hypothetical protein
MVDVDTFVTILYVLADDFCKTCAPEIRPGPDAALSRSEVVTLALFGQFGQFASERAFDRYARAHLRWAFPTLPDRTQLNRQIRQQQDAIARFALWLADWLVPGPEPFEVLDCVAAKVRDSRRRGSGWLPQVMRGKSNRLGWYIGFNVLTVASPAGIITGFGFGTANTNERPLAETLLCLRDQPDPRVPSTGHPRSDAYLADTGFWGPQRQASWSEMFGVTIFSPPEAKTRWRWPRWVRRRFAHYRQIIETVHNALIHPFRLDTERPHQLGGFAARLAAKVGLYNFCCWLNRRFHRPLLAFADLVDW